MATTLTYTALDAVTEALQLAGITDIAEAANADDADHARKTLRRMLKAWQAKETLNWAVTTMAHTLTTAAAQTLSPVRPVRILHVNYRNTSSNDMPMTKMTREEYDCLSNKSTTGTPTCYYYDRQRESAVLYVWPLMASVTTETLQITYEREMPDFDALSETLDVPSEVFDAVVVNLADRLTIGTPQAGAYKAEALALLGDVLAGQNDGSVWFGQQY